MKGRGIYGEQNLWTDMQSGKSETLRLKDTHFFEGKKIVLKWNYPIIKQNFKK